MSAKRTSGALMTSLVVHGVLAAIAGIYLVTQTQQFKDLVGAEVLQAKEPPKPQVRKPVIKPIVKPTVPTENTVIVEQAMVGDDAMSVGELLRSDEVPSESIALASPKSRTLV